MFKENKKILSVLTGVIFLSVMLFAGYSSNLGRNNKLKYDSKSEYHKIEDGVKINDKKNELQTRVVDENLVTLSTNISYKVKHNKCNHENIINEKPKQDMLGLDRKSFEKYVKDNLPEWKMDMFSKHEILLSSERDAFCQKHFIVGEKNGKIAIFIIDENGNKEVHRIFKDTTISTITEENQKRLKEGIVVDSEEEAIQVLEDFIS